MLCMLPFCAWLVDEIKAEMNFLKFGQTMLAEIQKRFKENKVSFVSVNETSVYACNHLPCSKLF